MHIELLATIDRHALALMSVNMLIAASVLMKKLCSTHNEVILLGDFNLPHTDWSLYHAPDNAVYNNFLSFFNSYGFIHHVNIPTVIIIPWTWY